MSKGGDFVEQNERAGALLAGAHLSMRANTDDEQTRAMRYVASSATDVDDCRDLLQMLGLIEPDHTWTSSTSNLHRRRRT